MKTECKSKSVEYSTWKTMKSRCYAKSQEKRGKYKENNITVCDEWLNSFDKFLEDMGPRPEGKYTLERIDNSKSYCKENCKWVSWDEQSKNRGTFNKIYTFNGETKVLKDWARTFNIKPSTLYSRIRRGLSFEDAIKEDPYNKKHTINGESKTLKEWCDTFNMDFKIVNNRVSKHGWEVERAVTTPIKRKN